jgi:two-component system nitrogen regulation response regulator GlnG
LNVFQIHLPALRDRPGDVRLLADHFLRRFAPQSPPLPAETLNFLEARPWLGNVRELRNAIEHAAILARDGALLPAHFPPPASGTLPHDTAGRLGELVKQWVAEQVRSKGKEAVTDLHDELLRCVEPALLDEVLRQVQGNRLAAARSMGLARATVRKLIARYRAGDADQDSGE